MKTIEVCRDTTQTAFSEIAEILGSIGTDNFFIALDTEFCIPDGVESLPWEPETPDKHYSQLRSYVNGGDIVQVGIGFADRDFNLIGGNMFQFNLFFDHTSRSVNHPGIKFLREVSGLNLEEHATRGLSPQHFVSMLRETGILHNDNITWVSFMGYPDFGFIISLLRGDWLPESRTEFLLQVRDYFPSSCDCKFFSKFGNCIKKERIPGKLEKVAIELGAKRSGKGLHQAASDALLTLRCLKKLKGLAPEFYQGTRGVLYGIHGPDDVML